MNIQIVARRLKNKTVNIYQKPITREQFEGSARVLKVISFDEVEQVARCKDHFKEDGSKVERFIFVGNQTGEIKTNQKVLWKRLSALARHLDGTPDFETVRNLRNRAAQNQLDSDDIEFAKELLEGFGY